MYVTDDLGSIVLLYGRLTRGCIAGDDGRLSVNRGVLRALCQSRN